MALMRWEPTGELESMRRAMDRWIDMFGGQLGRLGLPHMELGKAVLDRLLVEIKEYGAAENPHPDVQGNRMAIVIAPNK